MYKNTAPQSINVDNSTANILDSHSVYRQGKELSKALSESFLSAVPFKETRKVLVVCGIDSVSARLELINSNSQLVNAIASCIPPEDGIENLHRQCAKYSRIDALPYKSGSFPTIYSAFGTLAAKDIEATSAELLRVISPKGKLAISNWLPTGISGELMNLISTTQKLSVFRKSSELWGTRCGVHKIFDSRATYISTEKRRLLIKCNNPQQWVVLMYRFFYPVRIAYDSLDHAGVAKLTRCMLRHARHLDHAAGPGVELPLDYQLNTISLK